MSECEPQHSVLLLKPIVISSACQNYFAIPLHLWRPRSLLSLLETRPTQRGWRIRNTFFHVPDKYRSYFIVSSGPTSFYTTQEGTFLFPLLPLLKDQITNYLSYLRIVLLCEALHGICIPFSIPQGPWVLSAPQITLLFCCCCCGLFKIKSVFLFLRRQYLLFL